MNFSNALGNTALHYAVERGCMEIILILILNGADPAVQNQNKQNARTSPPN